MGRPARRFKSNAPHRCSGRRLPGIPPPARPRHTKAAVQSRAAGVRVLQAWMAARERGPGRAPATGGKRFQVSGLLNCATWGGLGKCQAWLHQCSTECSRTVKRRACERMVFLLRYASANPSMHVSKSVRLWESTHVDSAICSCCLLDRSMRMHGKQPCLHSSIPLQRCGGKATHLRRPHRCVLGCTTCVIYIRPRQRCSQILYTGQNHGLYLCCDSVLQWA